MANFKKVNVHFSIAFRCGAIMQKLVAYEGKDVEESWLNCITTLQKQYQLKNVANITLVDIEEL